MSSKRAINQGFMVEKHSTAMVTDHKLAMRLI